MNAGSTALLDAAKAGQTKILERVFMSIIDDSFVTHPMVHRTHAEEKRRCEILICWFRTLRGEKKWSLDRTLSSLRRALTTELDQVRWVPSNHSSIYAVDERIEPLASLLVRPTT